MQTLTSVSLNSQSSYDARGTPHPTKFFIQTPFRSVPGVVWYSTKQALELSIYVLNSD